MDTKPPRDREIGLPKPSLEHPRPQGAISPPSSTSSPSHEFSFTISLQPCPHPSPTPIKSSKTSPSFEIDLAPADDIFFHGHLLPLHLLSNPAFSPRSSNISLEDLPAPPQDKKPPKPKATISVIASKKWRKATEDVTRIVKKWANMVMFFKGGGGKDGRELRRRPYSFSGNLNGGSGWKKRRGEFSAPASMRTSPTNSGLLLSAPAMSYSGGSSMEELQSAIQAAIAHCKNSSACREEKVV